VATLESKLKSRQKTNPSLAKGELEALRERVKELEQEADALRIALDQQSPDRELGAQLRRRHAEYETELQSSRELRRELQEVRSQILRLEQEDTILRAKITAQEKALHVAEEASHSAARTQRDLAAYVSATAEIVAEVKAGDAETSSAGVPSTASFSPFDLSLTWARLREEMKEKRRNGIELQQNLEQMSRKERQAQAEIKQLKCELVSSQARADELQLDLKRAKDESLTLHSRVTVLREAISRGGPSANEFATLVGPAGAEPLNLQLESAKRHAADLQRLVDMKDEALKKMTAELDPLRNDSSHLADAVAKANQLERTNADLWRSNCELEKKNEELTLQAQNGDTTEAAQTSGAGEDHDAGTDMVDYDRRTTKVLHLTEGPKGRKQKKCKIRLAR